VRNVLIKKQSIVFLNKQRIFLELKFGVDYFVKIVLRNYEQRRLVKNKMEKSNHLKIKELEDRIHVLETCMDKLLSSRLIHREVASVLRREIEEVCNR